MCSHPPTAEGKRPATPVNNFSAVFTRVGALLRFRDLPGYLTVWPTLGAGTTVLKKTPQQMEKTSKYREFLRGESRSVWQQTQERIVQIRTDEIKGTIPRTQNQDPKPKAHLDVWKPELN